MAGGMKIGELFMELGFEVDEKTLKSFNSSINDTLSTMLKLGGVTASVAGFAEFMKGAADSAVALRNFNSEFGYSQKNIQEYVGMLRFANPLITVEQAQSSYRNIAEYILNIKKGGGAGALSQLGVQYHNGDTPDDIIKNIYKAFPSALNRLGRDRTSDLINHVLGAVGGINIFEKSLEDLQRAAEKGVVNQKSLDDLVKYDEILSDLSQQWKKFVIESAATIAPGALKIKEDVEKNGFLIGAGGAIEAFGTWAGTGIIKGFQSYYDNALAPDIQRLTAYNERNGGSDQPRGIRFNNPGNLMRGDKEIYYNSALDGLVAMANNLKTYGGRGWDSIDEIVNHWAPAGGKGNSAATASSYKATLMRMTGFGANDHLNLNDPYVLRKLIPAMIQQENGKNPYSPNLIERAAGGGKMEVNIHISGSDPTATAKEVERIIESKWSYANGQINNGSAY